MALRVVNGRPLRVLLVIDELDVGGTEQQIVELVRNLPRDRYRPIVFCFRHGRKAAPQVRIEERAHRAVVPDPIDDARLDDDEGEPRRHERFRDLVVSDPLGLVVDAEERSVGPVRLVDDAPMGVAKDRQRAGVHPARHAEVPHGLEHGPGAFYVDAMRLARIRNADLVPGRRVEDAIDAGHRAPHAGAVGDIPGADPYPKRGEPRGCVGPADERHDVVAVVAQLAREHASNEAGRADQEIAHASRA
jgi:hypothetical protein